MNKRIRELAKQAGINFFECTNIEHGGREYCEAWIEQQQKFAELIVRECMDICSDSDDYLSEKLIKNHFEIEK